MQALRFAATRIQPHRPRSVRVERPGLDAAVARAVLEHRGGLLQAAPAVARVLDISPHTVKRHVANILDKLALASRGQAAAWLRDHG